MTSLYSMVRSIATEVVGTSAGYRDKEGATATAEAVNEKNRRGTKDLAGRFETIVTPISMHESFT